LITSLVVVVSEVALLLLMTQPIMNAQQNKEIPIYLTLKELAELLKVKPRTIYAWVSGKRIPFERKGGLLRFRLDAVVAWNEPAR
jgi:excisionase family DNA binding protein